MMKRTLVALTAALGLLLTACAPATEAPPAPAPTESVEIPQTPAGDATRWVLAEMNADADTTADAWAAKLTADFQAEVGADEVAALINRQIRPARPLVATAYRGTDTEAVTTVAGARGEPFDLSVAVDADNRISGLFLGPVTAERTPAASTDEVGERLAQLPADVRVFVEIDGEMLLETDADALAPLGSIFKLYVLGAVADAVAAGTIGWDDTVTVTDALRSLPSGELQDAPAGTVISVREAAQKMIAISDNTATDMLIDLVGRDAVEAAVADMGRHAPESLRPFLTTREMFALMWGGHDDLRAQWASGGEEDRRAVLDALAEREFTITVDDVDQRVSWTDGMEWFASARDIAAAHAALFERGEDDGEVLAAVTQNSGIVVDAAAWPKVAFKGGGNVGVLTGSWRAERADGSVMTVVVLGSAEAPIDGATEAELFGLVADLFVVNAG